MQGQFEPGDVTPRLEPCYEKEYSLAQNPYNQPSSSARCTGSVSGTG